MGRQAVVFKRGAVARARRPVPLFRQRLYDAGMARKLTITVSDDVYEGLHRHAGRGGVGRFVERLVRPHVVPSPLSARVWQEASPEDLAAGYAAAAADEAAEAEAADWMAADLGDALPDEDFRGWPRRQAR